ncbi:Trk system potassium uptake protein trkA [Morganella morganii]|nr:Trk system potassium uptake protein trkA [Morganella morganii]
MAMKIRQKLSDAKLPILKLPPGTIIGAIVRDEQVIIANDEHSIEQGDHVVLFITDKRHVPEVEKLFQPSPFFL